MKRQPVFDVAIIGAGASGSVAARELCEHGHRVALLDAGTPLLAMGPRQPRGARKRHKDYPIQSRSEAFYENNRHLFVKDTENPYQFSRQRPFYWIRSRSLGGRMNLWTGECYRMSDIDFKAASRDRVGIDWPLTQRMLAPHYEKAEELLGVRGHLDRLPVVPDGRIIQAAPLDSNELLIQRRLLEVGKPAILDRMATFREGKSPTVLSLFAEAEGTGNLSYFPGSVVQTLEFGKDGLVRSVRGVSKSTNTPFEVRARAVVLCASTLESTRILLSSETQAIQRSRVLGRYLTDHIGGPGSLMLEGLLLDSRSNPRDKRRAGTEPELPGQPRVIYIPRYQNLDDDPSNWHFHRGFCLKISLHQLNPFHVKFNITAFGEALPYAESSVTLNRSVCDRWGSPSLKIRYQLRENEKRMFACMKKESLKIAQILTRDQNGFILKASSKDVAPGLCNHEVGTVRMGDDPRNSFLNSFCRSHEIENLYVTDGSSFPNMGTANPTLTLMAQTFRACADLSKKI